jgi:uncharacterized protein YlxP (DUF503 family)
MAVHVLALRVEIHLPASHSLKDKRAVVKSILEGARRRYQVAAAETAHHDRWQRSELGFAAVASSPTHLAERIDEVERFVWSFPEAEVLTADRSWMESDA